jgi:sugar phosphate isomerase/epimerase
MEIGFVTNCLGKVRLADAVQVGLELGFDCLEVGPTIVRDRAEWAAVQQNGPIRIHSFIYGRNFLATAEAERKAYQHELMWLIETALAIGVSQITTTTGANPKLTLDQNIEEALRYWSPILSQTQNTGLRFALEFCPAAGNFALGPYAWRKLLQATRQYANFGLNYDPSHLLWQFIEPYDPIAEFFPAIFSVHAKDARIHWERLSEHGILQPYAPAENEVFDFPTEHSEWWEYVLPGEGQLDWARFLGALMTRRYRGAILVEHEAREYLVSPDLVKRGLARALSNLRIVIEKAAHGANPGDAAGILNG